MSLTVSLLSLWGHYFYYSRPLFHPCKCSGSIGFIHQECLQSWLAVNHHSTNKCELCGVTFRFAKQYAEATPDRLPWWQVVGGVTRTCILQWLPLTIRVSMALSLWLIVAPFGTAMIYHGWMHGNMGMNLVVSSTATNTTGDASLSIATNSSQLMPDNDDPNLSENYTQYAMDDHEITTAQWIQKELVNLSSSVSIRWNILADEIVSGFVLVAVILFSFLSIMSFVDFLRAEWQEPQRQEQRRRRRRNRQQERRRNNINNNRRPNNLPLIEEDPPVHADNVDAAIAVYWENLSRRAVVVRDSSSSQEGSDEDDSDYAEDDPPEDDPPEDVSIEESNASEVEDIDDLASNDERADDNGANPPLGAQALEERIMAMMQERAGQDSDNEEEEPPGPIHNDNHADPGMVDINDINNFDNNNANGGDLLNNNDNLNNGLFEDDPEVLDADINIALDEMLGVRGPLWVVARNLMWLLAFNTLYLALFAFVPRIAGSISVSMVASAFSSGSNTSRISPLSVDNATYASYLEGNLNATVLLQNITIDENATITDYSLVGIFNSIERESHRVGTTFRLKDFSEVAMGYVCAATMIVFLRYVWMLLRYKPQPVLQNAPEERLQEALLEVRNILQEADRRFPDRDGLRIDIQLPPAEGEEEGNGNGNNADVPQFEFGEIPPGAMDDEGNVSVGVAIDVVLAAASSIVKVGVLLFMKMFLLPVFLGVCLDLSTLSLFERTVNDCILYAGRDLFSFLFLHWVAGITFMLLVTVSVLQLREVVHPNVLAHVIRPQEPQPDLLGNLLHDPVLTHSKRLALSLLIYSFLLALQVYVPVSFYVNIWGGSTDFLQLKLNYMVTPRLQIPIELVVFHLCMLTFLEKNKNSIGELQHYWLKFICRAMNFDKSLLPHEVGHFELLGSLPIIVRPGNVQVEGAWRELKDCPPGKERTSFLEEQIIPSLQLTQEGRTTLGIATETGARMIQKYDYIRIPTFTDDGETEYLSLPTKVGRYRINRKRPHLVSDDGTLTWQIQVWEERIGLIIPRPPEGWDDLGAGGADEQGRWAWDREKKSSVECSVATRDLLFPPEQSTVPKLITCMKLAILFLLSWFATIIASSFLLAMPLFMGRLLLHLLRVPDTYTHDPFCFALGSAIVFPLLRRIMAWAKGSRTSFSRRFLAWLGSFRPPPISKAYVLGFAGFLWFICCPIILGLLYEVTLVWPSQRFDGLHIDIPEVFHSWLFGSVMLNLFSVCCVAGTLTRQFWAAMLFEDPLQNNPPPRNTPSSSWQGANGRMSRFWSVWKAVLCDWEWEKVDPEILMKDCALPIFSFLGFCLCVPVTTCLVLRHMDKVQSQAMIIRLSGILAIVLVTARNWREEIKEWFNAAHNTARDERYLVGRLLTNYQEVEAN